MPENHNTPITDEMIRIAVCRELDSIEAPPVESAWQHFQARQSAGAAPAAPARRGRPWTRYSAIAAALLLFFFGGYGVYRTLDLTDSNRVLLMGTPESADSADDFYTAEIYGEKDETEEYSQRFNAAEWDPVEPPRDVAQSPPEALDGYLLDGSFTREAGSGNQYLAFLYTRADSTLLWVQSDARSRDQFIDDLEQLLQLPVETFTTEDTQSRNSVNGLPALIWEEEGRYHLLWEIK